MVKIGVDCQADNTHCKHYTQEAQMSQCTVDSLRAVIAAHGGLLRRGAHSNKDECCVLEARSVCIGIPWTDSPEETGMPDIRPLNDAGWSSDEVRTEAMIALAAALDDWANWTQERQLQWSQRITLRTTREILPIVLDGLIDVTLVDACRNATTLTEAANAAARAARAARTARTAEAAKAARTAEAAWAAWAARTAEAAKAAEAAEAAEAAWAARTAEAAWAARTAEAAWAARTAEAAWAARTAEAAWAARTAEAAWAARTAEAAWAAADDSILHLACRIWIEEAHASATA